MSRRARRRARCWLLGCWLSVVLGLTASVMPGIRRCRLRGAGGAESERRLPAGRCAGILPALPVSSDSALPDADRTAGVPSAILSSRAIGAGEGPAAGRRKEDPR
jgi:hypothetical protein